MRNRERERKREGEKERGRERERERERESHRERKRRRDRLERCTRAGAYTHTHTHTHTQHSQNDTRKNTLSSSSSIPSGSKISTVRSSPPTDLDALFAFANASLLTAILIEVGNDLRAELDIKNPFTGLGCNTRKITILTKVTKIILLVMIVCLVVLCLGLPPLELY